MDVGVNGNTDGTDSRDMGTSKGDANVRGQGNGRTNGEVAIVREMMTRRPIPTFTMKTAFGAQHLVIMHSIILGSIIEIFHYNCI